MLAIEWRISNFLKKYSTLSLNSTHLMSSLQYANWASRQEPLWCHCRKLFAWSISSGAGSSKARRPPKKFPLSLDDLIRSDLIDWIHWSDQFDSIVSTDWFDLLIRFNELAGVIRSIDWSDRSDMIDLIDQIDLIWLIDWSIRLIYKPADTQLLHLHALRRPHPVDRIYVSAVSIVNIDSIDLIKWFDLIDLIKWFDTIDLIKWFDSIDLIDVNQLQIHWNRNIYKDIVEANCLLESAAAVVGLCLVLENVSACLVRFMIWSDWSDLAIWSDLGIWFDLMIWSFLVIWFDLVIWSDLVIRSDVLIQSYRLLPGWNKERRQIQAEDSFLLATWKVRGRRGDVRIHHRSGLVYMQINHLIDRSINQ